VNAKQRRRLTRQYDEKVLVASTIRRLNGMAANPFIAYADFSPPESDPHIKYLYALYIKSLERKNHHAH
jgi:hypothetical protein